MTQELVDKVRAYVDERRKERENSPDPRQAAIEHLKEIGYLDENGEVSEAYRGGIPDRIETIRLIVDEGTNSYLGRVKYDDNLIVEEANSVCELEIKMKKLLSDFHDLDEESYELSTEYALPALFKQFDFLSLAFIAKVSGIDESLIEQYASGEINPSLEEAQRIEAEIKRLASQLSEIRISAG